MAQINPRSGADRSESLAGIRQANQDIYINLFKSSPRGIKDYMSEMQITKRTSRKSKSNPNCVEVVSVNAGIVWT